MSLMINKYSKKNLLKSKFNSCITVEEFPNLTTAKATSSAWPSSTTSTTTASSSTMSAATTPNQLSVKPN